MWIQVERNIIKRMQIVNLISAVAFLTSSLCLFLIPCIDLTDGLPKSAYILAAIFWLGLVVGASLQIYLKIKCQKMKLSSRNSIHRILYVVALLAFSVFLILVVMKSQSSNAVVGSLFCTIISLQSVAVIKRKESLK